MQPLPGTNEVRPCLTLEGRPSAVTVTVSVGKDAGRHHGGSRFPPLPLCCLTCAPRAQITYKCISNPSEQLLV